MKFKKDDFDRLYDERSLPKNPLLKELDPQVNYKRKKRNALMLASLYVGTLTALILWPKSPAESKNTKLQKTTIDSLISAQTQKNEYKQAFMKIYDSNKVIISAQKLSDGYKK